MKSDARSSLNVSVNRIPVPTPENVSKTALRAQNPALDTRSCGEISCDECNERFTALQAENQQLFLENQALKEQLAKMPAIKNILLIADLPSVIERFWQRVHKTETCWLWITESKNDNYGVLGIGRTGNVRAHRLSWVMRHQRNIPNNMEICHKCDVKRCVNPDHLFLGTHHDNMLDAWHKGLLTMPPLETVGSYLRSRTICKRGHELAGENVFTTSQGNRSCRICQRMHHNKWQRKRDANRRAARTALSLPKGDGE